MESYLVDPSANPLREGLQPQRAPERAVVVIFGASGDLTQRKLVPALYDLARDRLVPDGLSIVGFARRDLSETFRQLLREGVDRYARTRPSNGRTWEQLAAGISFVAGDFADPNAYRRLGEHLDEIDRARGTSGNRLYYLATPPSAYREIVGQLGAAGLAREETGRTGWRRIVIEKPFGRDLETARSLNRCLAEVFAEGQVYRIDHYLGKETVQNILVFRFANGIFEPIWNRRYVDHVQITVSESLGVERRGPYYEQAGALRDIVQNHALQLLSLVAMEPPIAFDADAVRDEKVKVLRAIRPLEGAEVAAHSVRGQYTAGHVAGETVPGYREEFGVSPESTTETFVALRLFVDNWRWSDVPFYVRSGKRLPKRSTEIAIQFRRAPHLLFGSAAELEPSVLVLRIQPDEGISLRFGAKLPGPAIRVRPVAMDFRYGTSFGAEPPDAYERLLLDCMLGDSTLFTRRDEIEAAWQHVTRIAEAWSERPDEVYPYEAGTWGPTEADELVGRDGRAWRRL